MRDKGYNARQSVFSASMTPEQRDLVARRTKPFLDSVGVEKPLPVLLAEAYLQGMRDAVEAMP